MKKFFSIVLALVFMLPSVGVHIDFTHCCGELTDLSISHGLNVSVTECCEIEQQATCQERSEIAQSPVYQSLNLTESFQVPPVYTVPFSSIVLNADLYASFKINHLEEKSVLPDKQSLSLFQVFLC